jgi:hypothetical protein
MSEKLSEIFDVVPVETVEVLTQQSVTIVEDGNEDDDFKYARSQTYHLIEKGHEALDVAMKICRESENPRAIEVLSGLIKNLSDINKSLILLNKDKADVKAAKQSTGTSTNVGTAIQNQNIIFAGNSKDLNKLIAASMKKPSDIDKVK